MKNAVVVLAAGKGTRMKSRMPKVLHKVAGTEMISHVINAGNGIQPDISAIVYSHDDVAEHIRTQHPECHLVMQEEQLGTGHAVKVAKDALKDIDGNVMVLNGDCPLITEELTQRFLESHIFQENDITFLSIIADDPTGWGRVIRNQNDDVISIREHKDATPEEHEIDEVNAGFFIVKASVLWGYLEKLKNNNAQGEYYLTNIVDMGVADGLNVGTFTAEDAEDALAGINSRLQLAMAEDYFQNRKREEMMANGVTMIDPQSVFFSADTKIGQDVEIGPNVRFGKDVRIESGVSIEGNCYFENAHVNEGVKVLSFCRLYGVELKDGATAGPFSHTRGDVTIGENGKIGSFVEMKKSSTGSRTVVPHLSYIGDATIGADVNVGAGTITCNYDGKNKHKTVIEDDVHTGSNSCLVAPVTVKKGATTAAGSIITKDVPENTLVISKVQRAEDTTYQRPRKG